MPTPPDPPRAPKEPTTRTVHGDTTTDDYAWMADRDDPRLRAYLEAENAYTAARTAHVQPLVEAVFGEIKARTQETDLTVPVGYGGWWYYSRTVEGLQYPIHGRVSATTYPQRPSLDASKPPPGEVVLLDENAEAQGHEFFEVGASEVTPDGTLLAYSVDVTGDERYTLVVRDVETGRTVDDAVGQVGYGLAWSRAGTHLFYTRVDEAWRPFQVWRHEIGRPAQEDVLVVEEPDERFGVAVGASRDDRWVVVGIGSSTSTEYRLVDADAPTSAPIVVAPRRPKVEYDVEPLGDEVYVVHNRDRVNFELARARVAGGAVGEWERLDLATDDEYVTGVDAFAGHLAISLRRDGQTQLRIVPRAPLVPGGFGQSWDLDVDEPVRTVRIGDNPDPAAGTLQVRVGSLVTPGTVYDYDLATRTLTLLKRAEVLGGYDPADYVESREWAKAPDGVRVPISVVRHRSTPLDGTAPGVLYGYGAYGMPMDPAFSVPRLSWLERGVVFAIAHVRGGSELGRSWYDDGKLATKQHTFDDFAAAARRMVELGYVAPDRLAGQGGSAGGLLIGAIANQAPELFAALHLQVPFVDVLTTMLDPDLPLTAGEWEEWGDPVTDEDAYQRIKAYSPYDNLAEGRHPAVVVTTNVHDTRVLVTEPAKWVARLRALTAGDDGAAPVLFRTELRGGHAGASGRYDAWREQAWELAVLLDLLGAG